MSLGTAEIDCTVSPPLSGAMEDCSIVRGPQLQRLCRQNCCMSGQRRMFGPAILRSRDDSIADRAATEGGAVSLFLEVWGKSFLTPYLEHPKHYRHFVIIGLASHWPCVTDSVVYPPTGSMALKGR